MLTAQFFTIPGMADLAVTCAATWFSLFLRGLQFKNVQHERLLKSTIISSVIKIFDLISIAFAVNTFNFFIIVLAGFSAGLGTLSALYFEKWKKNKGS